KIYTFTCLISFCIIWAVYIPLVFNTPANVEHAVIEENLTQDPLTLSARNLLHLFEGNTFTRAPEHYLLGMFETIIRVGSNHETYILGHFSEQAIPWFFPVAWLLKTPLTIIILFFEALGFIAVRYKKIKKDWGQL